MHILAMIASRELEKVDNWNFHLSYSLDFYFALAICFQKCRFAQSPLFTCLVLCYLHLIPLPTYADKHSFCFSGYEYFHFTTRGTLGWEY